jgi:hypothetical protein
LYFKRFNRLTLAFSKKLENFEAAVSLHFAAYNFLRTHSSVKMTPAMEAGVESNFWSYGDQSRKFYERLHRRNAVSLLKLHGYEATYVETARVEEFQGETIWQGDLKIFELTGQAKAKRGFGWRYVTTDSGGRRYFRVLELPPVDSPQSAVKAAIMSEIKNAKRKTEEGRKTKFRQGR